MFSTCYVYVVEAIAGVSVITHCTELVKARTKEVETEESCVSKTISSYV